MVTSQFSQYCVITAHISAERHLSKISYENLYSPWPPLTFKAIIIFHAKPFFTSAQGPTVKFEMNETAAAEKFFQNFDYIDATLTNKSRNLVDAVVYDTRNSHILSE